MMAYIRKRPNGKYQATISLGRDENGKRRTKSITKQTLKECKMMALEIEHHLKSTEVK